MKTPALVSLLLTAACLSGCAPPEDAPASSFKRNVEKRSGLLLYTPSHYAVSATNVTGLAGFRFEDPAREVVAAVVETTDQVVSIQTPASQPFTSPVSAREALRQLMVQVRKNMPALLPMANPDPTAGEWSISEVHLGSSRDLKGNPMAYGRFSFSFSPAHRLKSFHVYRFLAAVFFQKAGLRWGDFPRDVSRYFNAGNSAIDILVSVSLYDDPGFFTGMATARRVALAFAVLPTNTKTDASVDVIDEIIALKTFGTIKHTLVPETKTWEVPDSLPPSDIVVVLDANGTLAEEAPRLKEGILNLVRDIKLAEKTDFHLAFLTNGSSEFVRLKDGKRYLSADTPNLEQVASAALDAIYLTADGTTFLENELLRQAVWAVTEPAAIAENAAFRREGAPLLLLYATDRDDASPALDGSLLKTPFGAAYANWLSPFDRQVFVAPSRQGCRASGLDASAAAPNLTAITRTNGETYIDLCRTNHQDYVFEVLDWSARRASLLTFDSPGPMPFTLKVSHNGVRIAEDRVTGYVYDLLEDSLDFNDEKPVVAGDIIGAEYLTLKPPAPRQR